MFAAETLTGSVRSVGMPVVKGRQAKSAGTYFTSAEVVRFIPDNRHSKRRMRPKNEIGIHSVRGGTIVGEHEVIFAGHEEVITLSHSAQSKGVFASGAIAAARFLVNAGPGLYDMNNIINND